MPSFAKIDNLTIRINNIVTDNDKKNDEIDEKLKNFEEELSVMKGKIDPIQSVEFMEYKNRVIECRTAAEQLKDSVDFLVPIEMAKEKFLDETKDNSTDLNFSSTKIKNFLEDNILRKIAYSFKGILTVKDHFKINKFKFCITLKFSNTECLAKILDHRLESFLICFLSFDIR